MSYLAAVRLAGFHSSIRNRLVFSVDKRDARTQQEFAMLARLYQALP